MMGEFLLSEVAGALGGSLPFGDCRFSRVCTDTRALQRGDLFVALRGERFDAHEFLQQARDQGACGLVVEKAESAMDLPQWVVDDSTVALGQLARLNRERFNGPVVAITGSGGKTTVKTLLSNILGRCGHVLVTQGNLNNQIGVPLTLFQITPEHDFAVIEMGASGPGEIAYLVSLAKPQVGLVNNALRAHVEGFGSPEGVARAKGEMFAGLASDGVGVVNLDDPALDIWREQIGARKRLGFSVAGRTADVSAAAITETAEGCGRFTLRAGADSVAVQLRLVGRHNIANALAAAACAHALGIDLETIRSGLEASDAVTGRMESKPGVAGSTIIDDSYNANPDSARVAVDVLTRRTGRRILALGDMAELGPDADKLHRELGDYAHHAGINTLVAVGPLSRGACETFGEGAHHFDDHDQAVEFIKPLLSDETTVLVKGSRSSRMERVVAALISGEQ
ncbi:UDP-N-acetylmuramoyl-tripeptide--D-alanyl-D-alanine ligase [Gilvimarinus sp. F26214L]|uniref:UDP-N-acetylmuramoyl-tripeptide--D-alanyl-D- alanine ligase n=1 Tax=Gilvimarinus sp. DZF01 TaxID=3461371 RepID=UPI0040466D12